MTWLEFSSALLTEDGERFPEELALDGTHLHPSYVKHLERALP